MGVDRNNMFNRTVKSNSSDNVNKVKIVSIETLHDFPDHPFSVVDNSDMDQLKSSIEVNGVLNPIIVRAIPELNGYQIISGHRRVHACRLLGKSSIPAIIKELDNDHATIEMVDSNLQREYIPPTEIGYAYLYRQRAYQNIHGINLKGNDANKEIREIYGVSNATIKRFIRLTQLNSILKTMVDGTCVMNQEGDNIEYFPKLSVGCGYYLSYLDDKCQMAITEYILNSKTYPTKEQCRQIIERAKETMTPGAVLSVLEKKNQKPSKIIKKANEELDKSYKYASNLLENVFHTRCKISGNENYKGRISIPFDTLDDLNKILEIAGAIEDI